MIKNEIVSQIRNIINKYKAEIIKLNDFMADNPEISSQEFLSSQRIVDCLRNEGLEVEYPFAGLDTAFKTSINKNKSKKAAVLVEYDALPGIGHGCGHCASASISVLAGLILHELRDIFDGQVDLIGTPDEEVLGGKIIMAEKGVFDKYDFAIMIHMDKINIVKTKFLALDGLEFNFIGKASHASASPWEGRNALNGMQLLFHSIDMMRQHIKPDVRIHGYIKEGGKAPNIVPDFASAEIYTRGLSREYLNDITEWVKDCGKAAALATRSEVEIKKLCPSLKDLAPNETAEGLLFEIYKDLGLEVTDLGSEAFGSSDMGDVDYICPAFHPTISINEPYSLHTKDFANTMKSEKTYNAILLGAEIISRFILNVFSDSQLLENIKADYRKYRKK